MTDPDFEISLHSLSTVDDGYVRSLLLTSTPQELDASRVLLYLAI